jgi:hypothetical protein
LSQVDTQEELETFWRNYYLRGPMFYDPTGVIGGTYYQQPYGGVPFSRGWVIAPDQTIALALFGHDPQLVIDTIRGLLLGVDCAGSPATTCLHLDEDGGALRLRVARGVCEAGDSIAPHDVVRGWLHRVRNLNGAVDLGKVECVADDAVSDRITDLSPDPAGACPLVPVVFYLAKPASDVDYGRATSGAPRLPAGPVGTCP